MKILRSHNLGPVFFAILIAVLFFFNAQAGLAQNKKKQTIEKKQKLEKKQPIEKNDKKMAEIPLHVVSDRMIAQKDASMIEFIGHVKATRDDAVILADSIKIFIHTAETKKNKKNDLKKIIATGNVEYTAGERKAFADKAVYTTEDEILILTGEAPRLVTGKSQVTGKKITLFRNDDRALVESDGKTRVQAIFDPEDQKKEDSKKEDSKKGIDP